MTDRTIEYLPLDEIKRHPRNPKDHDEPLIDASIARLGFIDVGTMDERTGEIIDGHGRLDVLVAMHARGDDPPDGIRLLDDGRWAWPVTRGWASRDDEEATRALVVLNRATELGGWKPVDLRDLLAELPDLDLTGWATLEDLPPIPGIDLPDGGRGTGAGSLAERFLVPPFSVLDARQGWWQDRKRAWIALGIQSELGRGEAVTWGDSEQITEDGLNYYRNRNRGRLTYAKGDRDPAGMDDTSLRILNAGRKPAPPPGGTGKGAWLYRGEDGGVRPYDPKWSESIHVPDTDSVAGEAIRSVGSGTSIFDPVLCELVYRWFVPPGGLVLDPFAGGSVRGIVASRLGRGYVGVDLSEEQIAANRMQGSVLCGGDAPTDDQPALTPIERHGDLWVKRDDLYSIEGSGGGKVRSCWALMSAAAEAGATGFVTAGSRHSPQVNIVAGIARRLGLPCTVHVPAGEMTAELGMAVAQGAAVRQHRPGYNSVIVARARDDAAASGFFEVPFGMECADAVTQTASQIEGLPDDVARIVVPVGSGMTLAGILTGLAAAGRTIPVLGVVVGADPTERLDRWAPSGWRNLVELRAASVPYERSVDASVGDVVLDPVYEAKCAEFLEPGDLLWVVGVRATARPGSGPAPSWIVGDSRTALPDVEADLVFSCPPYADLEEYSDDPADLSTLDYPDFRAAHADIIAQAVKRLRNDRYAVWVIGEARGSDGNYYGLVPDTIRAFAEAGCALYNEAILVTAVGSLPVRAGKQFAAGRKLGKTHQNVLVFVKGDGRAAADACGVVDVEVGTFDDVGLDT